MKYYIIDGITRIDPSFCLADGVPAEVNVKSYHLSDGIPIMDIFPNNAQIFMRENYGTVPSDFIGNTDSIFLASYKLKELIEENNKYQIEYLPVSIIDHQNKVASEDYFIINPIGSFDCLDIEASNIKWFKDKVGGRVIKIYKYVLSQSKIADLPHLFRVKERPSAYVISEELLKQIRNEELTNINVEELEMV